MAKRTRTSRPGRRMPRGSLLADHHKTRVAQAGGGAMAAVGIAMLSGMIWR
jgi:hypothetical protein